MGDLENDSDCWRTVRRRSKQTKWKKKWTWFIVSGIWLWMSNFHGAIGVKILIIPHRMFNSSQHISLLIWRVSILLEVSPLSSDEDGTHCSRQKKKKSVCFYSPVYKELQWEWGRCVRSWAPENFLVKRKIQQHSALEPINSTRVPDCSRAPFIPELR